MRIRIDRELPVPVPLQLQGQIEFGVTNGDFPRAPVSRPCERWRPSWRCRR
jgi:hypothetical protein